MFVPLRLLCLLAFMASLGGCIKENLDDCPNNARYWLTVRAYERGTETELGAGVVTDLSLFVFDGDSRFLYKIETTIGQKVALEATQGEELHIVAWGNLKQGHQSYTDPQPGDRLEDCFVELDTYTRAEIYAFSPDALFRGELTIAANNLQGNKILPIYREVGSLTVSVKNLKSVSGYNDGDFSIVVRETHSRIGFDGMAAGTAAAFRPNGTYTAANDVYSVPAFNLLAEETGVQIDIYHHTTLLMTVLADSNGNPIIVEKDKLTNVLIDLKALLSVSVVITDWGSNYVWKEF